MVISDKLARLQVAVSEARVHHENLAERQRIMAAMHYKASADTLQVKVDRAFTELERAKAKLQRYLSKQCGH